MPAPLAAVLAKYVGGELLDAVLGQVEQFGLTGHVELDTRAMTRLARGIRKAVVVGVNRGAKPVREAAVSAAQAVARHGFTAKSIGTKQRTYPTSLTVLAVVGPKMSFSRQTGVFSRGKRKGQPRKHVPFKTLHFLEKGTKRSRKKPVLSAAEAKAGEGFKDRVAASVAAEIAKLLG